MWMILENMAGEKTQTQKATILYDSIFTKCSKQANPYGWKLDQRLPKNVGEGKIASDWEWVKVSFWQCDRNVLKYNSDVGCTTL